MVGTGLQRDIGGGTHGAVAPGSGIAQGHDFCMGPTGTLGVALADDLAIGSHQHATDAGIGGGNEQGAGSQVQRGLHRLISHGALSQ